MKTIQISDEMYNSLMEISKELNIQSHRGTAMPYFFQIRTQEQIAVPEGNGRVAWHNDGGLIETEEEVKEAIYEYKEWERSDESKYDELMDYEKEKILNSAGYNQVNYDYKEVLQNAFFTEKACKKHIEENHYHYNEPDDYLNYASRNPEMELVMKFLCELSGGKLHK